LIKKLKFAVENIRFEEDKNDSQFVNVFIDAFASGDNLHHMYVSEKVLRRTAHTLYEKPLVWVYDSVLDDIGTHDEEFQVPGGFIPKDKPMEFKELEDGRIMLSVWGKIWKKYSGRLLEFFERDSDTKPVSVEMNLFEHQDHDKYENGEILDYAFTAITMLGSLVTPAIPGAKANVMAFAKEEEVAYQKAFSQEFLSIPEKVKASAKLGLALSKEYGDQDDIASFIAEHLANSEISSLEKIQQIIKRFTKDKIDILSEMEKSPPSKDYIAFQLCGGIEGYKWAKQIIALKDDGCPEDNKEEIFMTEKDKDNLTPEEKDPNVDMSVDNTEDKDPAGEAPEQEPQEVEKPDSANMSEDSDNESNDEDNDGDSVKEFNLDMSSVFESLKEDTEEYAAFEAEFKKPEDERNYAVGFGYVYARMCGLQERMAEYAEKEKVYMAELEELRSYKADMEKENFDSQVNVTLKEVEGIVPEDEMVVLREDSANFDLQTLDGWKNAVKAKAFSYSKKESENSDVTKVALPWMTGKANEEKGIWDD